MARIVVWIVCVAFTTTSAYIFPRPRYPLQHQNYQALQYGRVQSSTEQESPFFDNHQKILKDQLGYQRREERAKTFKRPNYVEKSGLDGSRVTSSVNGHRHQKIPSQNIYMSSRINPSMSYYRAGRHSDIPVIYKEYATETRNIFTPEITENCDEWGICENSPDYPHEYVEALLAQLPDADARFTLNVESLEAAVKDNHLDSNETLLLCKTNVKAVYPDKVRLANGRWVFVVNGRDTKVQGYIGTTCIQKGKLCDRTAVSYRNNYTAICDQVSKPKTLWVLDDFGQIFLAELTVPACCVCVLVSATKPKLSSIP